MTKVIHVEGVNDALMLGIRYLLKNGIEEDSRNGKVLVAPGPVITEYSRPFHRVLFSPSRDANPFFHLMEALWMLAGRNDLEWPAYFNKRFEEYSDDGRTVHGAYGHRWRKGLGYDQLEIIIKELTENPSSRRCVLQMWDGTPEHFTNDTDDNITEPVYGWEDLHKAVSGGKDVPCNTHIYFDVRHGKLNMTVCCRSNDIIWGAYGANVVHFSILQEYMAAQIGVEVGVYRQMSNNYHAYLDIYDRLKLDDIADQCWVQNYYQRPLTANPDRKENSSGPHVAAVQLVANPSCWDRDLKLFLENPMGGFYTPNNSFFERIAVPMYCAWKERKEKVGNGFRFINQMPQCDWKIAAEQWIQRREAKKQESSQ